MRYFLLLCSLMFGLSAIAAEPEFPKLSGRVVDNAQLLSAVTTQNLNRQLAAQEQRTGNQLVVVTLNDLQGYEIADFGFQLGRHWGIGQKDSNNGALLMIAKQERKMRIEVGYGLEGKLTDARSAQIIQQILSPAFKTGDFNGGITRAVDAMILVIDGKAVPVSNKQNSSKSSPPALGLLMFIAVIFMMMGGGGRGRGRGRSGLLGGLLLGSALSRGGSGGFGGGGFGGGGFGGGGGGFGGGGASGGW